MDERFANLVWILGFGGGCALLGALFGAVSAAIHWGRGNATGTIIGLEVARAFERGARNEFSPRVKGAIVGGVDGLVFLGVVGTVVSTIIVWSGPGREKVLGPAMLALVLLMALAVFFGLLAYGIFHAGVRAVVGVFAGGVLGGGVGFFLGGHSGVMCGCIAGITVGNLTALLVRYLSTDSGGSDEEVG
jgi:hypothetical protein